MTDVIAKPESAIATAEKKDSSKVCRYFKKGFCGYGEKCLFSHSKPKIRPRLGYNNPSEVENCRFFKKASCKFAFNCWYKHIRPDGKPLPKPDPLNKFIVVGPSGDKPEDAPTSDGDSAASTAIPPQERKTHRSFKRPQNLDIASKNCFYYEKKGTCCYGDKCWYSHSKSCVKVHPEDEPLYELDPEFERDPDHTKLCYNFTFEVCEFGDDCAYVHGDICQFCDLAFLHPFDEQQRKEHLEACEIFFLEDMEISFQFMRSKFKTCTICLDYVWGLNKLYTKWKFGIQDLCHHIFCLDCIRHWRALKRRKGQSRHCPACRTESSVVVPSTYWFKSDNEKTQWVDKYKAAVNKKPCRFYEKGKCLNKEKCHYLHLGFIPPVEEKPGDDIWGNMASNNEFSTGEQEGPGNLAEGTENIIPDRNEQNARGQNVQDTDCCDDTPPEDTTNEDLAFQSGEQASTSNLADEHQGDDSLGQVNIVDDGDERNVEKQVGQDSDIWEDAPPEDQTNEDLAFQSGEQASTSNLADEHQGDDSLGKVNKIDDDERNVEKQVGQHPDIWEDTPPEDQSNEDSVLQSAEQISASNLVQQQFDDNLEQVDVVDDQLDVERQVVVQDPDFV